VPLAVSENTRVSGPYALRRGRCQRLVRQAGLSRQHWSAAYSCHPLASADLPAVMPEPISSPSTCTALRSCSRSSGTSSLQAPAS
jgi:hypothetical protein